MLDNPLIRKPLYCHLWNILLLLAQHKRSEFIWCGGRCSIETGQLLTGRKKLSKLSGISMTHIERILKYLELEHQITQVKTNKFRIITIVNWGKYQNEDLDVLAGTTSGQQKDNRRTTEGQQKDTYKNVKNVKNVKNDKKRHTFVPPSIEEVKKYIQENPELSNIDPVDFFKGYSDGGWIDTQGKPVRNWKLKLRTRSKFAEKDGKDAGKTDRPRKARNNNREPRGEFVR